MAERHLSEERIVAAALELEPLARDEAEHLHACAQCAREVAQLSGDLTSLGRSARELCPAPPAPRLMDLERPQPWWSRLTGWLTPSAAGAMVGLALVVVVVLGAGPDTRPTLVRDLGPMAPLEAVDSLPGLDLAGDDDPRPGFQGFLLGEGTDMQDEGFMEFMAPADDDGEARGWGLRHG